METKTGRLLLAMAAAARAGGGIHTTAELAYMLGEPRAPALTKFLADCVKKGRLRRVATGVYESVLTPPEPACALYLIVKKKRADVLNYISLESQLSATGDISQVMMDRLTVMTKGRSGCFTTAYGVIEFTHTKLPVRKIIPKLYFDKEIQMYRANTQLAKADLTACGRNLHMLEG